MIRIIPEQGGRGGGVETVVPRLFTIKGETAKAMQSALYQAGLFLKKKSQEVVPVDTGLLRSSAYVVSSAWGGELPEGGGIASVSGFRTTVKVGYDWQIAPYAVYVHEMTWLRHKPGKIAKFLELPAMWFKKEMREIVRREAQRKLKSFRIFPQSYGWQGYTVSRGRT